jgi:hypothetical protein
MSCTQADSVAPLVCQFCAENLFFGCLVQTGVTTDDCCRPLPLIGHDAIIALREIGVALQLAEIYDGVLPEGFSAGKSG